ncbi:dihydropteroate synthase [Halomicrobium salinisoli]|uniref:dihydropteroate synthase n=1 Tax=Halomicrobium salinisoli TaxID=2878391 RepID=UPI001CEFCFE8|nr:dihydropteroate synthase [Halomicrobium salinisoli]
MRNVDAAGLGIGDDHPTRIMGVLNVSSESPYDPSVFADPGEAAAYVDEALIGEGADIVDVGLESANKRFEVLSAEEELERLDTAVQTVESTSGDAVFSIETRYHEVAEAALERGFDMVNDICGFADPEMPAVCEEYDVAVAKMASPPDIERPGAVEETPWAARKSAEWAESADYVDQVYEALQQNGITDKTIVDPAFGGWSEAQTLEDDRETLRRLREFRALGRPTLISINRKNFLRSVADRSTEEALPVSLAATAMAVDRGAHVVRTHDVAETVDAAKIGDAFRRRLVADAEVGVEELDVTDPGELRRHAAAAGVEIDPEQRVRRALRVTGLDEAERERLEAAAAGTDATVAGADGALVIGTPEEITDLAESAEKPALTDALSRAATRSR